MAAPGLASTAGPPETLPQVGRTASKVSRCSQLQMPGKTQGLSVPWVPPTGPPDPRLHARGPQRQDTRSPSLSQSHPDDQGPIRWGNAACLWGAAGIWGADSFKGNSAPGSWHGTAPANRQVHGLTDGARDICRRRKCLPWPVTWHQFQHPTFLHEKTKAHPAAPGTGASRWPVCSETHTQAPRPSALPRPWPRPT